MLGLFKVHLGLPSLHLLLPCLQYEVMVTAGADQACVNIAEPCEYVLCCLSQCVC